MKVEGLIKVLNADFYTGVPDSLLKPLCNYLMHTYGIDRNHHVIAANEGNCVGVAAGYHMATGKYPVVYMQNSGEGNIVNPVASLLNDKVYAIPMIFIIGWRGEPGKHDEPQHVYQGEITVKLLEDLGIENVILDEDMTEGDLKNVMGRFNNTLSEGKPVAFVVRKGALSYDVKVKYSNEYDMSREDIIKHIIEVSGEDPIVSTTGKASRELFEAREAKGQGHGYDFLTVGSMGHTSSIAMGVALNKPDKKVWCIDGDGSAIMHLGALAVLAKHNPENMVYILINNESHETVGGLPTVSSNIDWKSLAAGAGFKWVASVDNFTDLDKELNEAKKANHLTFIEVKCALGARDDLGRPTTTALENKIAFMEQLKK